MSCVHLPVTRVRIFLSGIRIHVPSGLIKLCVTSHRVSRCGKCGASYSGIGSVAAISVEMLNNQSKPGTIGASGTRCGVMLKRLGNLSDQVRREYTPLTKAKIRVVL
jgi:hypothetical protein